MRLAEITVNSRKKLMDILKGDSIINSFYEFYEYHHEHTNNFTDDLYRIYNPTELSNIQEDVYMYQHVIPKIFTENEQPVIMINELTTYFGV